MDKSTLFVLADEATRMLFDSIINYSNQSDFADEEIPVVFSLKQLRGVRVVPIRQYAFYKNTIPSLNETQFRRHFRMSRIAFEGTLNKIGPSLKKRLVHGRPRIDPEKQLLSVLWLLATPDSFRSVAEKFGMNVSSLHDCFCRVVKAINRLAGTAITWPSHEALPNIQRHFQNMSRTSFQNVVGEVDGCHIAIKAPGEHAAVYVTRKCEHAVTLQGICSYNLKFIDVFIGYPGSVSDRRIFENSTIYQNISRRRDYYLPDPYFIIGDKAYPVLQWCIPPYINRGNLTRRERKFNVVLSRVRHTIERCFAHLKGRFRRLKYLDINDPELINATIMACCVLHNICIDYGDALLEVCEEQEEEPVLEAIPDEREANLGAGAIKRDAIMLSIDLENIAE